MVTSAEFTQAVSNLSSDTTQRLLDLRAEVLARAAEMSQQTLNQISLKANQEDVRQIADSKADLSVVKTFLN